MASNSWNPDIGWVLLQLVRRGRVRVCNTRQGYPEFIVHLVEGDQVNDLMRTVRRPLDVACLNLCIDRKLCFHMCESHGSKDVRYTLLSEVNGEGQHEGS